MLNIILVLIISALVIGKDIVKPVHKNSALVVISNEDLHLLNEERIKNGLDSIDDETHVDEIIQDELDKQLDDKLNAFKNNKQFLNKPMPLAEKWGHVIKGREPKWVHIIKVREEARGDSFKNTMDAIIYDNPKREKEVLEFYQKNCKYFCQKLHGTK